MSLMRQSPFVSCRNCEGGMTRVISRELGLVVPRAPMPCRLRIESKLCFTYVLFHRACVSFRVLATRARIRHQGLFGPERDSHRSMIT